MNKKNLTNLSSWWVTICLLLCCGVVSIQTLSAQSSQPKWDICLGAPGLESPTNVSANGFTATWSNVINQEMQDGKPYNEVFFRLLLTREILAKETGPYKIAHTQISPNPSGKNELIHAGYAYLDKQLSQPDWSGAYLHWTPEGVSIASVDLEGSGMPKEMIGTMARISSPMMNLSHAKGRYTLEFTAKVLQGKDSNVEINVFGFGEELEYDYTGVPGAKKVTIPNDGKTHKFSLDMEYGSWCHRIVLEMVEFAEVEFSGEFVVQQQLEKGDRAFRSTYFAEIPYDKVKCERADVPPGTPTPQIYALKYSYDFDSKDQIDPRSLNLKAAQADGERVAYRMLYADKRPGYRAGSFILTKSMYSKPSYFDSQEEDNNYIYLGYCNYESPNYEVREPSGPSWAGYHGGAIKLTKELLKEYIGSKVVGIRLASAACMQKNQVNDNPGFLDVKLPCIYLAKSVLTIDKSDYNNPQVLTPWEPIMVTSVNKLEDGWNTLFFDKPYEITAESEFFAGVHAYDEAAKGGILVRSLQSPGVDPNSAWIGTNWSTYTLAEAEYRSIVGKGDGPLLLQVIIEPKSVDPAQHNRGELRGVKAPQTIFSDEALKPSVTLFNTGSKSIAKVKLETDLAGKKQEHIIELPTHLGPTLSQEVALSEVDHEGVLGKVTLTVTLLEVNGIALQNPSVQTAELDIFKRDEAFERTSLVEIHTSEACQFCPEGVTRFENILNQPENARIKNKLAIVSHHAFFSPDFLYLPYSEELAPFYGVQNKAGYIQLVAPSSPTNMINRKPIPSLGDAKGQNGSVYSIIRLQTALDHVAQDAVDLPALVYVEVKPWFKKEDNLLNVVVRGRASSLLDRSRPIYLTIMITQDAINPRNQKYTLPIPNFVHTNVLRYVDEGGFKGTEVQFDERGNFEIVKNISLQTTDAQSGTLPANTILLEGDVKTLADAMKHVNVIAFLHHYTKLPTADDVEENDPRLLGNEVLNAAQCRVSFTGFEEVETPTRQDVRVTIQNGAVRIIGSFVDFQVYDTMGRIAPTTDLQAGVYIVRVKLTDGSEMCTKLIAE